MREFCRYISIVIALFGLLTAVAACTSNAPEANSRCPGERGGRYCKGPAHRHGDPVP